MCVLRADRGAIVHDGHTLDATAREMVGEHVRFLLQRTHLVVEHEFAASDGAPGVVDAWQSGGVGEVAHDDAVVADGRTDDRQDALVFERHKFLLDVERRAARQTCGQLAHELDFTIEGDRVEPELHRFREAVATVVLREVVQQPEQDGSRGH